MIDRFLSPVSGADRYRAAWLGIVFVFVAISARLSVASEGVGPSACVALAILGITMTLRSGRPANARMPARRHPEATLPTGPAPAVEGGEPPVALSGLRAGMFALFWLAAGAIVLVIAWSAYALSHIKAEAF